MQKAFPMLHRYHSGTFRLSTAVQICIMPLNCNLLNGDHHNRTNIQPIYTTTKTPSHKEQ